MNKVYSMLGLARKGGKISIGFDVTCSEVKAGRSLLVMLALDASDKTKKNIQYECEKYNIRFIEYGEKELLGQCLGKKMVSVLSVNDENITSYLLNNI